MDLVDQGKLLSLAEEHHAAWVPWQETKMEGMKNR